MDVFSLYAALIILFAVNALLVIILERQARKSNELVSFLVEQFKGISMSQDNSHLGQIDSLIVMNRDQADRHQKQIESLLGLIDEMSSRINPDKISARQYQEYEKYLIDQAKNVR